MEAGKQAEPEHMKLMWGHLWARQSCSRSPSTVFSGEDDTGAMDTSYANISTAAIHVVCCI